MYMYICLYGFLNQTHTNYNYQHKLLSHIATCSKNHDEQNRQV